MRWPLMSLLSKPSALRAAAGRNPSPHDDPGKARDRKKKIFCSIPLSVKGGIQHNMNLTSADHHETLY